MAFDLVLALVVSSVARPRINARWWRVVHWTAYACWPVAVAHGLGIGGADTTLLWVRVLTVACVLVVLAAAIWRATARDPDTEARRRPFEGAR